MAEFKRQHTVSKSYLQSFANCDYDDKICQYKRGDGSSIWVSPKDATIGKYIYSIRKPDGSWNHAVEHALSATENIGVPVIAKLIAGDRVSTQERFDFAMFVAGTVRRPKHLTEQAHAKIDALMADREAIAAHVKEHRSRLVNEWSEGEIADLEHRIERGEASPSIDAGKVGYYSAWLQGLLNYAWILNSMHWQVLKRYCKKLWMRSFRRRLVGV